jgi:hypothetical protein
MPRGQLRNGREAKKPKKEKPKDMPAGSSFAAQMKASSERSGGQRK